MDTPSDAVPVLHVNKVDVLPNSNGGLQVTCAGDAATTGWTKPELRPQSPLADNGILHLGFLAVAPTGPVAQMIEELCAEYHCADREGFTAILVRSKTNSILVPLSPA